MNSGMCSVDHSSQTPKAKMNSIQKGMYSFTLKDKSVPLIQAAAPSGPKECHSTNTMQYFQERKSYGLCKKS